MLRRAPWHRKGCESAIFGSLINVKSLTLVTGGHEGHKGYFESGDVSGLFCYCFDFLIKKYDERKKCPKFGTPFCLFLWCVKKALIVGLFKKILSHAGSSISAEIVPFDFLFLESKAQTNFFSTKENNKAKLAQSFAKFLKAFVQVCFNESKNSEDSFQWQTPQFRRVRSDLVLLAVSGCDKSQFHSKILYSDCT